MPTYAYRCSEGHEFEVLQSITAAPLQKCGTCGGAVRRVVFPVGIVFKGQGFYKTDSRSGGAAITSPTKSPESKPAAAETKPAAAETKAAATSTTVEKAKGAADGSASSGAGDKHG